ncbi:MAG: hypothetical protein RBR86_06845 [Pseudobdellovibrionaceae bacterium]|jgi:hypothetical protein|nr:hypothetical protein [Pseudobdellovibrionaceae bacterium]
MSCDYFRETTPTEAVYAALEATIPGARETIANKCVAMEIEKRVALFSALNQISVDPTGMAVVFRSASDTDLQRHCILNGDEIRTCMYDFMQDHGMTIESLHLSPEDEESLRLDSSRLYPDRASASDLTGPRFVRI